MNDKPLYYLDGCMLFKRGRGLVAELTAGSDATRAADGRLIIKALSAHDNVNAMLGALRKKAYAHWGSCATGLNDYYHRHASASNCSECGEREEAGRTLKLLEQALCIDSNDTPCFLTGDHSWCISHRKASDKCGVPEDHDEQDQDEQP